MLRPLLLLLPCRDDTGRTALHWAACLGLVEVAQALVAAGKRHAEQDLRRQQQLYEEQLAALEAAQQQQPAEDQQQQKRRLPPRPLPLPPLQEFQDKQGNLPLHLAARYCQADMVALLLAEAGRGGEGGGAAAARAAKAKNKAGLNPLHLAALGGCAASAAALQAVAPSAAAATTKQGLTAAAVAAKRGHAVLAAALQEGPAAIAAAAKQAGAAARLRPVAGKEAPRTLVLAPPECWNHLTCPSPIVRLACLPWQVSLLRLGVPSLRRVGRGGGPTVTTPAAGA